MQLRTAAQPTRSRASSSRRRPAPSGSVLVMVVALLTLVALIGTALIATARIDRYSTRSYARSAANDAVRKQFVEQAILEAQRTLEQDVSVTVDSFYQDTWLAERLPIAVPGTSPRVPMWSYISGRLATTVDPNVSNLNIPPNSDYRPPLQTNSAAPVTVANEIRMNPASSFGRPAVPTSISLTYPANHPTEAIRGKTRTFPAVTFVDPAGTTPNGPYLAADADGDGIADSVLRQMTAAPVEGVTYYYAVRIIDNAAAVNVNTAWSRDEEFDYAGTPRVTGFFTSSVGLYELLNPNTDNDAAETLGATGRAARDNEIASVNLYRFGYNKQGFPGNATFDPFSTAGSIPAYSIGATPIADRDADPIYGSVAPAARTDFTFQSQAEALDLQLASRVANPGYREGFPGYVPPASDDITSPVAGDPFQFLAFGREDAAALAYRFLMINPTAEWSELESRLRLSAYYTAPNYNGPPDDPDTVAWRYFPPNQATRWFQWLDYSNPTLAGARFTEYTTNATHFPSVRPLLTAWNPVHDRIRVKGNGTFAWDRQATTQTLLHPGLLYNDTKTRYKGPWASGTTYTYGDIVYNPTDDAYYMSVWHNSTGVTNTGVQPDVTPAGPPPAGSVTFEAIPNAAAAPFVRPVFWEKQPYVSGLTKSSVNTGGFRELWRSYLHVMTDPTGTASAFDAGFWSLYNADPASAAALDSPFFDMDFDGQIPTPPSTVPFMSLLPSSARATVPPTPPALDNMPHPAHMFRSPIRSPEPVAALPAAKPHHLKPYQTAVLRSALAAVNTVALRNSSPASPTNQDIVARTFTLYDTDGNLPNPPGAATIPSAGTPVPQYRVTVYSTRRQPFITEVYANNDSFDYGGGTSNPDGYVCVELHNPFDVPLDISNWTFATFNRTAGGTYATAGATLTPLPGFTGFPMGTVIPARGFLIVDNHSATVGTGYATYRPPSSRLPLIDPAATLNATWAAWAAAQTPPAAGNIVFASAPLGEALNNELVLLRPLQAVTLGAVPPAMITNMVPVDSYDFTGLAPSATAAQTWHYARSTGLWQFVYPGRYDGRVPAGTPRQQGTYTTPLYDPSTGGFDDWNPLPPATPVPPFGGANTGNAPTPITLGFAPDAAGVSTPSPATNLFATYPDPVVIQLNQDGSPGPNPFTVFPPPATSAYPFGTFARNGDILQVPFIGSYKIELVTEDPAGYPVGTIDPGTWPAGYVVPDGATANPSILDFNPVTMDAAFAEDGTPVNNTPGVTGTESIGRFVPALGALYTTYDWARELFNYLDVRVPANDYFPNHDPAAWPYYSNPAVAAPDRPQPVPNAAGTYPNPPNTPYANRTNEDFAAARQGRININTAPAPVLAALPMVPDSTNGSVDAGATAAVAAAIAGYRTDPANNTYNREFGSLFDLNRLPTFYTGKGVTYSDPDIASANPTLNHGDITYATPGGVPTDDGVMGDFEAQQLMLTRISNLVTTRSDCFTVYIVVQGWREAGTPFPVLDWEKRVAFIMDRTTGKVVSTPVPTD